MRQFCHAFYTKTGRPSSLSWRSGNSPGVLCIGTPVPGRARPSEWRKLWSPSFSEEGPPKQNVPPLKPLSCSKPLLFPLLIEAEMINRPWVYGSIKDKNHPRHPVPCHSAFISLLQPSSLWSRNAGTLHCDIGVTRGQAASKPSFLIQGEVCNFSEFSEGNK